MTRKVDSADHHPRRVLAGVTTYAAATLLVLSAAVTLLQGVSALAANQFVRIRENDLYHFDNAVWIWVQLVLGCAAAAVAVGLFWSARWARVAAIVIASISVLMMFMRLRQASVWPIVTIALDICIIWAVLTWETPSARHKREAKAQQ